jgi:hypothetical protein
VPESATTRAFLGLPRYPAPPPYAHWQSTDGIADRPPERIDQARRAATSNRLIDERVTEETADAWIAGWEAIAAKDGLARGAAYWDAGWAWIAAQRQHRVMP